MIDWDALRKEIDDEHGELDECGCPECKKIVDEAIEGNWLCEACGYDGEPTTLECACYDHFCNPSARGAGCFHGGLTCPLCDDGDRIDVVARALMRAVRRAPGPPSVDVDHVVLRVTLKVREGLLPSIPLQTKKAILDIAGAAARWALEDVANPLPIPQWLKDMREDSAQPWIINARGPHDGPPYEIWHSGGCGGRIGSFDDYQDALLVDHMCSFLVRPLPVDTQDSSSPDQNRTTAEPPCREKTDKP